MQAESFETKARFPALVQEPRQGVEHRQDTIVFAYEELANKILQDETLAEENASREGDTVEAETDKSDTTETDEFLSCSETGISSGENPISTPRVTDEDLSTLWLIGSKDIFNEETHISVDFNSEEELIETTILKGAAQPSGEVQPPANPPVPTSDKSQDLTENGNNTEPDPVPSQAEADWEYQKHKWGSNTPIDALMDMVGLEAVKSRFVEINTLIKTQERQKQSLPAQDQAKVEKSRMQYGTIFIGNPGTGKKEVAKLYSTLLASLDQIPRDKLVRTTGTRLATFGATEFQNIMGELENGGVLLIDDTHQLIQSNQSSLLDLIVSEIESKDDTVLLFAGFGKAMESLTGYHPTLHNLVPTTLRFPDYTDDEFLRLLVRDLRRRFGNGMCAEGGLFGPLTKIVAKRIGRGRRVGFGNVMDARKRLDQILTRQSNRLFRDMKEGVLGNHLSLTRKEELWLTQKDLVGPPPASVLDTSKAWSKIREMIGLQSVKDTLEALVYQLQVNYDNELAGRPLETCSLNKLFLGNPGTGKTTVAKLYGHILAEIGLLSNGEVVVKNPSDFIGDALGGSELKTRAILDSTKGKVLIIDEAYMLGGTDDKFIGSVDSFRTAIIDTIVGEVQSDAVEDRCVLLLGYKDRMENMLNSVNPALARRFPLASAFVFEDYTDEELEEILDLKIKQQGFRLTKDAKRAALEVLNRARHRVGFGNAGEVDILLDRAKLSRYKRLRNNLDERERDLLVATDIDENWNRAEETEGSIDRHFEDFVGCEHLIIRLKRCQAVVRNMKAQGKDPRGLIPFTFLFCGPPGTGKTTTAKRIGNIFYEMGFLATHEVMERSATHLIGEYVGHTGPKTQKLFDSALGRVLLIDEAYKLSEGTYAREAVVEMVNLLDSDRYRKKIVVILAGYRDDIHRLMTTNPGFTSRFPEVINFDPLTPAQCTELFFKRLEALEPGTRELRSLKNLGHFLKVYFEKLIRLPFWGNGRDIVTLAASIQFRLVEVNEPLPPAEVVETMIVNEVMEFHSNRQARSRYAVAVNPTSTPDNRTLPTEPTTTMDPPAPPRERFKHKVTTRVQDAIVQPEALAQTSPAELPQTTRTGDVKEDDNDLSDGDCSEGASESDESTGNQVERDQGVSDEIWEQLEQDKRAPERQQAEIRKLESEIGLLEKAAVGYESKVANTARGARNLEAEIWAQKLKELRDKIAMHKTELAAKENKARQEQQQTDELNEIGLCPVGFKWVRQQNGKYRCEGGTHYGTFDELKRGNYSNENSYDYSYDYSLSEYWNY